MKTWGNAALALTAAAVLALTTACGQEKGDQTLGGQPAGAANPAGAPADNGYSSGGYASGGYGDAGSGEAEPAGQMAVASTKQLGKVVTDSEGYTLYRFDKDSSSPPKATCEGDCAKAWPVVSPEDAKAPAGVDASLLGEVTRADGSKQLTLGGWPMYRYAKDTKPGDLNGQGVGGTWFASAPDGKKASAEADGGAAEEGAEEEGAKEEPAADAAGLSVREDPKLGEIVVDSRGMTVYRFKKDSAWPMKTACTGACLEKWPVVAPVDKNDIEGITKKGFVTFSRPDGIKQQTIDCWPLYTFAGDEAPGDTNGQGVGGTWYAVSPEGKLVGAPK
ncbi:SCO0930 family lipoprotein [Streptomyces sp. Je 1-79]|uniref:SCO0930 family lipoprotein n=1 Tax=Streptomyces sp. Je 1-79 TaxID=2943847 RepID=UPI0021A83146|nr:SCO0930 family lipoprotein [Streptomyces sp. Je 1-79]MCT4353483.1 SCO0930 family lipoprotein [Streptomyces sp. Je 1-79]